MEEIILIGNKLIPEFMGAVWEYDSKYNSYAFKYPDNNHPTKNSSKWWSTEAMEYHTSWDWLMPVVEKIVQIENGKFSVDISSVGMWSCFIKRDDVFEKNIADYGGYEPMILNVWLSVVEFIKWHNENKKA